MMVTGWGCGYPDVSRGRDGNSAVLICGQKAQQQWHVNSIMRRSRALVPRRLPSNSEAIALSARSLAQKTMCLLYDSSFVICPETGKRGGVGGDGALTVELNVLGFLWDGSCTWCAKCHRIVCLEMMCDFHLDNGRVYKTKTAGLTLGLEVST